MWSHGMVMVRAELVMRTAAGTVAAPATVRLVEGRRIGKGPDRIGKVEPLTKAVRVF